MEHMVVLLKRRKTQGFGKGKDRETETLVFPSVSQSHQICDAVRTSWMVQLKDDSKQGQLSHSAEIQPAMES